MFLPYRLSRLLLGTSGKFARFRPGRSSDMHNCAFCKNALRPLSEWKGNDGRFYCSEFCADASDMEISNIVQPSAKASTDGAQQ